MALCSQGVSQFRVAETNGFQAHLGACTMKAAIAGLVILAFIGFYPSINEGESGACGA